jgi:hypothetical protein
MPKDRYTEVAGLMTHLIPIGRGLKAAFRSL